MKVQRLFFNCFLSVALLTAQLPLSQARGQAFRGMKPVQHVCAALLVGISLSTAGPSLANEAAAPVPASSTEGPASLQLPSIFFAILCAFGAWREGISYVSRKGAKTPKDAKKSMIAAS